MEIEPFRPGIGHVVTKKDIAAKVLRSREPAPGDQRWRADQDQRVISQLLDQEPRIVTGAVTDPDVYRLDAKIDQMLGRRDPQIDARVLLEKTTEARHQPARGERGDHADRDHRALGPCAGAKAAMRVVQAGEDLPQLMRPGLTFAGQLDAPGPAAEQRRVQIVLFGEQPTLADAALYGQLKMLEEADPSLVARLAEPFVPYMTRVEGAARASMRSRQLIASPPARDSRRDGF